MMTTKHSLIRFFIMVLLIVGVLFTPVSLTLFAQGQDTDVNNGSQDTDTNPGGQDTDVNPGPSVGSNALNNPLKSEYSTASGFLLAILEVLLVFALPVIIFFIIYAGFLFVTARGDAAQITKARSALTWAVVGGVIVLGATLLVDVIQGTIDELR